MFLHFPFHIPIILSTLWFSEDLWPLIRNNIVFLLLDSCVSLPTSSVTLSLPSLSALSPPLTESSPSPSSRAPCRYSSCSYSFLPFYDHVLALFCL